MNFASSPSPTESVFPRRWRGRRLIASVVGCTLIAGAVTVAGAVNAGSADAATACTNADPLTQDAGFTNGLEAELAQSLVDKLNASRRAVGRDSFGVHGAVSNTARHWSYTMSLGGAPSLSGYPRGALRQAVDSGPVDGVSASEDYRYQVGRFQPSWSHVAEHVGVGSLTGDCTGRDAFRSAGLRATAAVFNSFTASSSHLSTIRSADFNQVGVGVEVTADDVWVTIRYMDGPLPRGFVNETMASKYIEKTFRTFLGRGASSQDQRTWVPRIMKGQRSALTDMLAGSSEWAGTRIDVLYRTVLHREADAGGRANWLAAVQSGQRLENIAAYFYGSPEYFSRAGNSNSGYVASLYRGILGRHPDPSGHAYWTGLLDSGRSDRSRVAAGFYASVESRSQRVETLYRDVLGRAADPSGKRYWTDSLIRLGDVRLAATLAVSDEFFNRSQR